MGLSVTRAAALEHPQGVEDSNRGDVRHLVGHDPEFRDDAVLDLVLHLAVEAGVASHQLLPHFLDLLVGRQGGDALDVGVGERGDGGGGVFASGEGAPDGTRARRKPRS